MRHLPKLSEDTWYVGVNDRRKHLFENIWPLPEGVSYNSYVILDEKTVMLDTVDNFPMESYLDQVQFLLQGRTLDYLIINHMEPDHASGIQHIVRMFPNVTLVGNKKTFEFLKAYYGDFPNLLEVQDSATLDIGSRKLQFYFAPMVHWPEVMMTYDPKYKILYSADAFGSFGTLNGGVFDTHTDIENYWEEFTRYYSNIVGKYGVQVQKIMGRLSGLDVKIIAPLHGPIWTHPVSTKKALDFYDKWSKYETDKGVVIAFASMYGNTEVMADTIARELANMGIRNIRIHDVSKSHSSYIIRDIFKYRGVILGSPTYNADLHPNMKQLIDKLQHMGVKNHLYASFGTFTWAGQAVKKLTEFGQHIGWEQVYSPVEEQGSLKSDKFEQCVLLAQAMAEKLDSLYGK